MKTAVVTLTDHGYFLRAKRTIIDIRSRGAWQGDLVLITVGFDAPPNFIDFYRVIPFRVEHLDTSQLLEAYRHHPIRPTCDSREFAKLTQWDKFYVFHDRFREWDKVLYVDAGLRVLDDIHYLADLDCEGQLMAPDDAAWYDTEKCFGGIIETDQNPEVVRDLFATYDPSILQQRYFLNCIWMYDTALLSYNVFDQLVNAMNRYPICRCNEMTIMNLIFTFHHKVWKPFPEWIPHHIHAKKRLFGWTEHDRDYAPSLTWRDFCFLKYPFTINGECE